jgi:hypothetical protein
MQDERSKQEITMSKLNTLLNDMNGTGHVVLIAVISVVLLVAR